ncbi:MAG: hypothetical protein ACKVX7_05560 [Planctomycetota bacterium]
MVDLDDRPDIVIKYTAADATNSSLVPFVFTHDAVSHSIQRIYQLAIGGGSGEGRVAIGQVDADAQAEVFTITRKLHCLDGQSLHEQWSVISPIDRVWKSLAITDLNGDEVLEAIVGTGRNEVRPDAQYIHVFDARNGVPLWQSPGLGDSDTSLAYLRTANIDGDPGVEIIVGAERGAIYVVDGVSGQLQLTTANLELTSLELTEENGERRLVVGDVAGQLAIRSATDGSLIREIGQYGARIDGLQVANVAGGSAKDFIFVANARLYIVFDKGDSVVPWTGPVVGSSAGRLDSMRVSDFDHDGYVEILLNLGTLGLDMFEIADSHCEGDLDGDRFVGIEDLAVLLANFGRATNLAYQGDVDRSGEVELADLALLLRSVGNDCR